MPNRDQECAFGGSGGGRLRKGAKNECLANKHGKKSRFSVPRPPKDAGRRSEVAGSRQSGYNSVVMVAHTVPGALLILEPTDTGGWPWG